VTETDSPFADVPVVILVSRHSASASEIVAGAIQDHDRGLIVGETTFGKGLVQTIMPLRNVRGYALALTTARYYTPSGRSIQRDYNGTALEDYVAPRDRKPCDELPGEAKLTDAGRKVYGGDGITPDYCIEPEQPSKFVANLISRGALVGFSRGYAASESIGVATIEGTVPSPNNQPAGCRFAPRCPFADQRCRRDPPPLRDIAPRHQVACWKAPVEAVS